MSPSLAFPPSHRLRSSAAYARVLARPGRIAGDGYVVLVRANAVEHARLGLAISKKCARRAVDRNRLKRLARESFRQAFLQLPPVDVVVMCARGAPGRPNPRLRATLEQAWSRIRSTPWVDFSSD